MAFYDTAFYVNFGNGTSTGYYAVTVRPQNTAVVAGVIRRQFTAPAVGSERVFICIVAGTTANTTDATWTITRGAKTTDGTATWQECTGLAAVNGDATNTVTWATAKAAGTPTLGAIIKRNNGASYQICTTAGTMAASEPSFSDTAGVTTNDGTSVWTSLGVVGNFTGGQAPFARLATVVNLTWLATATVSYTIYVGDNHAETQATAINITYTNQIVPVRVLCHNSSGPYPPAAGNLATGATVTTSGNTQVTLQLGPFYIYGIAFIGSAGGASSTNYVLLKPQATAPLLYFDNCSFQIANSVVNASILFGDITIGAPGLIILNNCTFSFGATSQNIQLCNCRFHWKNTGTVLAGGSSVPANLITATSSGGVVDVMLEALNLSQITTNFWTGSIATSVGQILVKDCKLHASMTVSTPPVSSLMTIQLARSDSGATAYKSTRYLYEGTETTETSITRVGGATDPTGQAQSRKVVTSANANFLRPFRMEPYAIWNDRTAANVVVTLYGTINSASLPNNDDIWMEVEYLGSSLTPLGTIVTTTKATVLSANAAVASDGSSWNGGGSGAGWSPFKLTTTLSSPQPQLPGYLHARIRAAKPSTIYYIDPQVTLS